ncbi:hypothetical protein MBOE_09810 [Mycolicibacterium boenickei]|uniref:Uncharacterized protein n=1 Tax=Mycolicibacterium boenickei TaxID=146017 RepID=A0ABN5Z7W3_9MYCO|nr:hypothetical protein MBOE_09810 [Mycolicibacterium boenickei]
MGGLRAALDDGYVPHAISGENDKATTVADANLAKPNDTPLVTFTRAHSSAAMMSNHIAALAISHIPNRGTPAPHLGLPSPQTSMQFAIGT